MNPDSNTSDPLARDVSTIQAIPAVATILDVVRRITGLRFAAVARVTEDRWVACSVLDDISLGLKVGGELKIETTICNIIRQTGRAVVIDHVSEDANYREHPTPKLYQFQSYISIPIVLPGDRFFGTLCALDPRPVVVNKPETVAMFRLFADLIAFQVDAHEKLLHSQTRLLEERTVSELREQFIGVLGHDLRNPLGALSAGISLLRETPLSRDQEATVTMMSRSVSRTSDLINDTLDFTRGRLGGGITLEKRTDEPLEPVLRQVISETLAIWKGRVVMADIDLLESVSFDRKRLTQLFTNLLSNAMTYGFADQPVTVRAESRDGRLTLSVANAAPPILPEVMSRLFEPFQRGGPGLPDKGLGLGLYIASEIARAHGGTISVESDTISTRFTFSMPAHAVGALAVPAQKALRSPVVVPQPIADADASPALALFPSQSDTRPRVLLVDDDADTLETLSRLLDRRGFEVVPAPDCATARQKFSAEHFDLVASDLGLSDGTGLQLIAELLAIAGRPFPAIAISGYGQESDIQHCKDAGFAEHFIKPLDLPEFVKTAQRLVAS